MALPAPSGGSITTAADQSSLTGYSSDTALTPAIQTIWSKEILFQAMPVLRFEQFAVKKTELGVMPGLTVNFMRYTNLGVDQSTGATLTEGTRMEPTALSASQIQITVSERGQAISVTELLLNASFDDVMASSSRLLGRHMAQSMDIEARNTLYKAGVPFGGGAAVAPSITFGRTKASGARMVQWVLRATSHPQPSRMRLRHWLRRTFRDWVTPTCASFTRRRAAHCVTGPSSLRSRSTPLPATSCSVKSVACTTWSSLRPLRSHRV